MKKNVKNMIEKIKKLEELKRETEKEMILKIGKVVFNSYQKDFSDSEEVKNNIRMIAKNYGFSSNHE